MPRKTIRNLRWIIISTCFLTTAVNYLDRQCLSVAAPVISKEFHFTNADYSSIIAAFLVAYTIMQFVSGALVDRFGARRSMAVFLSWWSVAGLLHALAGGLWSFRVFRFMLGMGEAGNWPASTKVVSEWFPTRERGLAVAIFDSGSSLGGLLAPPLVAWLIATSGWRFAFLVTGSLGFLLLVWWAWLYQRPEDHPRITAAERELILSHRQLQTPSGTRSISWMRMLGVPEVWGLISGRFLSDCVWWFYVYWLPKYLSDVRGFSLGEIAAVSWIPFLAVDLGNMSGGWLSSVLMRRGRSLDASRRFVLRAAALGMLAGAPAYLAQSATICVTFIALASFFYGAWGTMLLTLPTDLFQPSQVGVVSGLSGTGAGLGGLLFTWLTGVVVDHLSYQPIFLTAALLPLLALVAIQVLVPRIHLLREETAPF